MQIYFLESVIFNSPTIFNPFIYSYITLRGPPISVVVVVVHGGGGGCGGGDGGGCDGGISHMTHNVQMSITKPEVLCSYMDYIQLHKLSIIIL